MRTVKVEFWDDQDPAHEIPATQTRLIGLDGEWFETDLSDMSAKELDEFLRRFLEAEGVRKVGGQKRSTDIRDTRPAPPANVPGTSAEDIGARLITSRERNARIRAWAEKQSGLELSESWDRGYIPRSVRAKYDTTHPEDPAPVSA